MDILEPFDPAYLNNKPYEVPDISSYEKRFIHKVSIIEKKLRREKIAFEWLESQQCFRVKRTSPSGFPIYRYVYVNMDENEYVFGDEEYDLVFSSRVSEVIEAVKKWCNSNFVRK